jgi:ribosomal protein S18 acetylase RimI-like enzyme
MTIDIQPLTPDRLPGLASLFEQGGDPKWCWCTWFRFRGRDFTNSTGEQNRGDFEAATTALAPERAPGLVAYRDGMVVGWTSLGPRGDFDRLTHARVLAALDDTPVWSIVCFVVGRQARGQGIGRALLDAAIEYAREHGATTLEAYPVDTEARRITSANAAGGTLRMFLAAGFEVAAWRQANARTTPRPIVRPSL